MDLKDALQHAMKAEIEGRELYRIASERSDDEKASKMFLYLSREEDSHFEALKGIYEAHLKGERLIVPKLQRLAEFSHAESPIFSPSFKERLSGRHWEMSVLSIALKLEQDSILYYKKMADETGEKVLKDFFLELSGWEKSHSDALNRELNFLQEEYWEKNNFSPF